MKNLNLIATNFSSYANEISTMAEYSFMSWKWWVSLSVKDKHSFTQLYNYWNVYQTEWLWKTQIAQQFTPYWMIKRHKSWKWVGNQN